MGTPYLFGGTSNIVRFKLRNSSTGAGLTGLAGSSSSLIISTICDVEATATAYTAAATHIQTISTLGTFSAPSASECRFGEVDSTNHPGLYEFQFADARFDVSGAKRLDITVSGAASLLDQTYEIDLLGMNLYDGVHGGMSALPNTACTTNASLLTSGTGTDQLSVSSGVAKAQRDSAINGVSTSSVTTVNANIGETQPINFTGTGGSALVKSDMQDIAGSAVNASAAQLGVNVVGWDGAGVSNTGGKPSVNVDQINGVSASGVTTINAVQGTAQPVNFTGSGGSALVQTDVTDWKASTAETPAMTGDAYARLGAPAGASVSSDVAAIKSDTGTVLTDVNTGAGAIYSRLGAPAGASIAADIAAVKTDTVHLSNECLSSSIPSGTPAAGSFIGNTGLSSTDNFYQGCMLVFTSGADKGIARAISSYTGSSKTFSFTGATDAIDALSLPDRSVDFGHV